MLEKVHNSSNRSSRKSPVVLPAGGKAITSLNPKPSTQTILLAEDEESLRHIVIDLLTQLGYRVLGAGNGTEALAIAQRHPATIHALITHVLMPYLPAPDLAFALRHSH